MWPHRFALGGAVAGFVSLSIWWQPAHHWGHRHVNATAFYQEFHGHKPDHLRTLADHFRAHNRHILWLLGDSSLDNKHWTRPPFFNDSQRRPALNGYEQVLRPPTAVPDVAWHLNRLLEEAGSQYVAINAAVEFSRLGCDSPPPREQQRQDTEEALSTLRGDPAFAGMSDNMMRAFIAHAAWNKHAEGTRSLAAAKPELRRAVERLLAAQAAERAEPHFGRCVQEEPPFRGPSSLLPQDEIAKASVAGSSSGGDVLIVSVGSNDFMFARDLSPRGWLEQERQLHLNGEHNSFWAALRGIRTRRFLEGVVSQSSLVARPKLIIVCQIYYVDSFGQFDIMGPEVRDFFSRAKVGEDPSLLQQITRDQFNHGTLTVGGDDGTVHGVPVFPVPLFEVLDGQDSADYVERFEPSYSGGAKIAAALVEELKRALGGGKPRARMASLTPLRSG